MLCTVALLRLPYERRSVTFSKGRINKLPSGTFWVLDSGYYSRAAVGQCIFVPKTINNCGNAPELITYKASSIARAIGDSHKIPVGVIREVSTYTAGIDLCDEVTTFVPVKTRGCAGAIRHRAGVRIRRIIVLIGYRGRFTQIAPVACIPH